QCGVPHLPGGDQRLAPAPFPFGRSDTGLHPGALSDDCYQDDQQAAQRQSNGFGGSKRQSQSTREVDQLGPAYGRLLEIGIGPSDTGLTLVLSFSIPAVCQRTIT